ncbi:diguanylate cyclase [Desulfovibrio sp. OttesenSCG-928-F07]|nr:diguanylate cyclase [Desulfovibrio sp. OttesenSCG-928-F07]
MSEKTTDNKLKCNPDFKLSRVDLVPLEAELCENLRRFFSFSAHSFYFPHPDLYTTTPAPEYLPEEEKLLLPLEQEGGDFLGFFVARGVPENKALAALPFLPQASTVILNNLALARAAKMDSVTGLYNRAALFDALATGVLQLQNLLTPSRELPEDKPASAFVTGGQFSLLLIRLNGLAAIVRDYGYMQADELLALLGAELKNIMPASAFAARAGDYELALLMPSFSLKSCRELALSLQSSLAKVFVQGRLTGRKLRVVPSVGYINCPRDLNGLERRSPQEQGRNLVRRARLAAALASANLSTPNFNGISGKNGFVFDKREEEPRPVMAYADILREGGRVLGTLPLSRLQVSLGASAGARAGQSFTVWGYAVQAGTEKAEKPVISRRYKADIYLVEVGATESVAEILHTDDPQFPPEAGDYLRLGVSELYRGAQTAFYPDDAPHENTPAADMLHEDEPFINAPSTDDAVAASALFQGYADFMPRWSKEREQHNSFALILGRFALNRPLHAINAELADAAPADPSAALAAAQAGAAGITPTGVNAANSPLVEAGTEPLDPNSMWESTMLSAAEKCRSFLGADLLIGRYALNSLIFFIPQPNLPALTASLTELSAELAQTLGIEAAFGVAPHPFLDFRKADSLENAKKALDYAILLPQPHIGVLDSLALNISADRLCSLGDRLGAITEYKQAILCDANNILAWNSLGVLQAGLGRHKEARQSLEEALARDPEDMNTMYNLGNLHQSLGNFEQAEQLYHQCLVNEPENVFTIYRLGQIAEKQNENKKAELLYRKALELPGGAALTRRSLARLALKEGKLDTAREELHEALIINPHDAVALQLLAGLYLDAGEDPGVAESLARQSVTLRPDLRASWLTLARVLEATGKNNDAREALIKAGEL